MPKRVYIALAVLLVILAGVIGWQGLRLREPVYQGRPVIVWIKEGYFNPAASTLQIEKAEEAVLAAGTNALPYYLKLLAASDSSTRFAVQKGLRKLRWPKIGFTDEVLFPNEVRRRYASCALSILGEDARTAIPTLATFLNSGDENQMELAGAVLTDIGLEGIGPLTNLLSNPNPRRCVLAVLTLSGYSRPTYNWSHRRHRAPEEIDAAAKIVVPMLLRYTRVGEAGVRASAVQTLGLFAREPATVIPALAEILRDNTNDLGVKVTALYTLGEYGAKDKSAVAVLLTALEDKDFGIRNVATNILKQIDPEAAAKAGVK